MTDIWTFSKIDYVPYATTNTAIDDFKSLYLPENPDTKAITNTVGIRINIQPKSWDGFAEFVHEKSNNIIFENIQLPDIHFTTYGVVKIRNCTGKLNCKVAVINSNQIVDLQNIECRSVSYVEFQNKIHSFSEVSFSGPLDRFSIFGSGVFPTLTNVGKIDLQSLSVLTLNKCGIEDLRGIDKLCRNGFEELDLFNNPISSGLPYLILVPRLKKVKYTNFAAKTKDVENGIKIINSYLTSGKTGILHVLPLANDLFAANLQDLARMQ